MNDYLLNGIMHKNMQYVAYITKGLETVAKSEIEKVFPDISIKALSTKHLRFETEHKPSLLAKLTTIDDLGLVLCDFHNPDDIQSLLTKINLREYRSILSQYRMVNDSFSITTTLVGYNSIVEKLTQRIAQHIAQTYHWTYTERDHSNFDIRIFFDRTSGHSSIRLKTKSLHHRAYKTQSREGSLRPTVAAAMVQLATKGKHKLKILDTFCGSGTILCEAILQQHDVYGNDINDEAIKITRQNLKNLHYVHDDRITIQNAVKTNWPSHYIDCIISNLPWDKQIEVNSITELYSGTLHEYKRIVKEEGAICVLVTKPELFIKHAKKFFPSAKISTYSVGLLGQTPTIVVIQV